MFEWPVAFAAAPETKPSGKGKTDTAKIQLLDENSWILKEKSKCWEKVCCYSWGKVS